MNLRARLFGAIVGLVCLCRVASAESEAKILARVALVSDPHVNRATNGMDATFGPHFTKVISQINTSKVDFVLIAGDLTQLGKPEEFDDFRKRLKEIHAPVYYAPGNHDVGNKKLDGKGEVTSERVALYEKKMGNSFFIKQRNSVRILSMNSSLFGSGLPQEEAQWNFLEKKLTKSSKPTIAFMHYATFLEKPDEKGGGYWNIEPAPRKRLLDLFERAGVQTVLTGHLHKELVNRANGILFVTTPPVSFGLPRGKQQEGWTLVTLPVRGEAQFEFRYIDN